MGKRRFLLAVLVIAAALPAQAQEWAGMVKTAVGAVKVERGGMAQEVNVGDKLLPRDKLVTGKDGRVGVTLRDDTLIAAGPNSQLALNEFAFDAATQNGNVVVSVLRGVTAMVSGLVAKTNPQAMRVTTPTSTLGIRGTEFIVEVEGE
jgi:hypothetical protein